MSMQIAAPPPPRPRLLIADDDAGAVHLARGALTSLGELSFASDGSEAVSMARRVEPDLILLDGEMPVTDGFAACAELRADDRFADVPIVFVTRHADTAAESRAFRLGAADFIGKPYSAAVLRARVGFQLEMRRYMRGRARPGELQAQQARSLMLAAVAHEIGNPLNAMLGYAQLMAADPAHPLPPEQARRLAQIATSGRHLQSLMRDLIDISGFDAGRLAVQCWPLDAGAAVQAALQEAAPLAAATGVAFDFEPAAGPLIATGDSTRLHQCLSNLIGNAIKYNRRGGWVSATVAREGEQVLLVVRDSGVGLTDEQQRHLFEPFNRLGQGSKIAGSGLGLVVTQRLVHAMGGELRVDSEAGVGSRFTIALPAATV